ncbi:outer membrane protein [Dysgonomonas macrotermitis]|uniref:Outer membrane protein n=2 Tax=Dysgonomonas macrotermitis TaxID=1346286 RepID=A0A1M4TT47_9BACT|nr:outer membrane protein [Dysgonomonas macrotermitis]
MFSDKTMIMKKYFIAACLLFSAIGMSGQTTWSLRQCIDYAVNNNIEIKQQELQVKSAEIDLNTSKSSRLPDLNASASHTFNFGRAISSSTNGYIDTNMANTSLGISSSTPLFTGFKISNDIKAKEFSLLAATEGLEKAKDNMELQITSYFLDVLFKKEILKVYQEQVLLTLKQEERTRILVENGKVALAQLYDIKAQLAKDQLNVTTSDNDLKNSLLNLAQALNLQSAEGFDIEAPDVDGVQLTDNVLAGLMHPNEVYQRALDVKPHVKEAVYNVESSKKNLKVAQSGYWPTLNFNMGYSTAFQRIYNANNVSFKDQFNNNGSEYLGFSLSIPIFNRFQVRNQVRQARLDIMNQELNLDNVKLALYKEIQQAYQNAVSAQAKYVSTEKAYDAALESFKYAEERYQIGKTSVFEYSEAQTKLISSKSEQIQAKYEFVFRSKILDFYQGKQIEI